MVAEIQTMHDFDIMLYNTSTTTFTKAKKRWRRAYFVIYFTNTIAKNVISKAPTYSVIDIIQQIVVPKVSNDQTQLANSVNNKDLEMTDGWVLKKMRIMFGSNTYELPTRVGLFYFAVESYFKDAEEVCIDQAQLTNIVQNKDLQTLHRFDGVKGLAKNLDTNLEDGIYSNDLNKRRSVFGSNTYKKQPKRGFFYFVANGFSNIYHCMLMGYATLTIFLGIKEDGIQDGWYEGGSILLVVFLVIVANAITASKMRSSVSNIRNNIKVEVVRKGSRQKISIFDLVVGDVVVLNVGDRIPADGLFIDGHSLLVDESSMTGESELKDVNAINNPFLFSGAQVADGHCRMLVLSVGMNTAWAKVMCSITNDNSNEIASLHLYELINSIGNVGFEVATIGYLFWFAFRLVMTEYKNYNREHNGKHMSVYQALDLITGIFMLPLIMVAVVIPRGIHQAFHFILEYSKKRILGDQAMVRKLSVCEAIASATIICTDKTGTLTTNQMSVTKFWLGLEYMEPRSSSIITLQVLELLHEATGLNTMDPSVNLTSPTEKAIISWAVEDLGMDMEKTRQSSIIRHGETFNLVKQGSWVLIRRKNESIDHFHLKGAAERVLAKCSKYYHSNGRKMIIDRDSRTQLENIVQGMSESSLRCIAFAHMKVMEIKETLLDEELTLLGIVGLKDPCRPGSKKAIEACRLAGVEVKMITGENRFTAKAIATECGILESGQEVCEDQVVEGFQFRNFTNYEKMQKVDKIRVMARASYSDKCLMVKCLKQKGHVVAVACDGTDDALALKEADIGLSMGYQGTEEAKQSSDIVILDRNIASVSSALMLGRCVCSNIQKIIQFQLTTALVISFFPAVICVSVHLIIVQLLWVNLFTNTLGTLALASEGPTKELMNKLPVGRFKPLITNIMLRNLLAQAIFQITILLTLQFKGNAIFSVGERVKNTMIINTFVLCQVFNVFNSRKLEERNIFEGIHKNRSFFAITGITVILQIVMVEFLNKFADAERLNSVQWGICIGISALSWPIGWVTKLIPVPNKPFLSWITE